MNVIEHIPAPGPRSALRARYYHYPQNNSGGGFVINETLAHHVLIQAHSFTEANARAVELGIYFDGCETGDDCECCGDRWYSQSSDDRASDIPLVYREAPETIDDIFTPPGYPMCHVYHLDGSKTTYRKRKESANDK